MTTSNQSITNQNVLIIGGGNVGLSFALLLADKGIKSTLLEKAIYPTISPDDDQDRQQFDSRNMALSRRTVEIYREIGLWQDLQSHACRIDEVKISEQGSFGKATLDKNAEGVESFGQVMENAWLTKKLLVAVQANDNITLLDGATVTDIKQTANDVTITFDRVSPHLASPQLGEELSLPEGEGWGEGQTLTADLLVACDGQNSTARKLLGIGSHSHDYNQVGIVGVVMTDKPHNHQAIERFNKMGAVAVLPLVDFQGDGNQAQPQIQKGYRRSVVWVCPKGEEQRYLQDDDYFLTTIQQAFGNVAGKFVKAGKRGAFPLVKVLANEQVKGRCVIMGNAAHTLHPVAGQGFNLCMRDADTLAKMVTQQVMRGSSNGEGDIGDSEMLATYAKRRKADQKRVEIFCDAVVYGFMWQNPVLKIARNVGLIAFDKVPFVKPIVANFAMGLKA